MWAEAIFSKDDLEEVRQSLKPEIDATMADVERVLAAVQSLLECGGLLTDNLDTPFQTAIGFTDDTNVKQEVGILKLKTQDLPPKYGLTKYKFGTLDGFCRTSDPSKPNAPPTDCTATSARRSRSWGRTGRPRRRSRRP